MGLLDKLTTEGSYMLGSLLNPDLSTSYPSTVTGTPTSTANPGGPVENYAQRYNENNTYISNVLSPLKFLGGSEHIKSPDPENLQNTLEITNLDVENSGVAGGVPYKTANDPTVYPLDVNNRQEIRGYFAEPSAPPQKFNQTFTPNNTYLNFIKNYI